MRPTPDALTEPCEIPACGREADHKGPHRKVEELTHWRPASPGKGCARAGCPEPAVMELNRGLRRRGQPRIDSWWGYCAHHNYGRWVEDGRVFYEWRTS